MLDFKSVTTFLFHIVSLDTFEILLDLDALNQPFRARWATLLLHGVRPPLFFQTGSSIPLAKGLHLGRYFWQYGDGQRISEGPLDGGSWGVLLFPHVSSHFVSIEAPEILPQISGQSKNHWGSTHAASECSNLWAEH